MFDYDKREACSRCKMYNYVRDMKQVGNQYECACHAKEDRLQEWRRRNAELLERERQAQARKHGLSLIEGNKPVEQAAECEERQAA